jgi:hypothetical protein
MTMNRSYMLLVAAALAVAACKKDEPASAPPSFGRNDLKSQAVGVNNDTQTLAAVQAAAGDVIRNASDCDKVREFGPDALRAIADADQKVQTVTGRATLESLKKQIDAALSACPPA